MGQNYSEYLLENYLLLDTDGTGGKSLVYVSYDCIQKLEKQISEAPAVSS